MSVKRSAAKLYDAAIHFAALPTDMQRKDDLGKAALEFANEKQRSRDRRDKWKSKRRMGQKV